MSLNHPTLSPSLPEVYILSLLPRSSILTLRQVSRQQRTRINIFSQTQFDDLKPSLLSDLKLQYPLQDIQPRSLSTLHHLAHQCRHLRVTFPSSTPNPKSRAPKIESLPPVPQLSHIHIICPTTNVFDQLLAFKSSLQATNFPSLTHLTITDLSLSGIYALRFGSFSSFNPINPNSTLLWHRLQRLGIKLIPWWDGPDYLNSFSSPHNQTLMTKERDHSNLTAIKILHDWLHSFAKNGNLTKLTFAYGGGVEGPNPLLLEQIVDSKLFSAPAIGWDGDGSRHGLREVWLRGVAMSQSDIRLMKERIPHLRKMMLEARRVDNGVRGISTVVQGKEWWRVDLGW